MKLTDIFETTEQPLTDQPDTAEVSVSALPFLKNKIEKINKKAKRNKLPELTLEVVRSYNKTVVVKRRNVEWEIPYVTVRLTGPAPNIAGYKFIATIEHQLGGNIIRTVPGEENNESIKEFYQANPDYCDHCKKTRKRIDTFIVKEEKTGKLRQVGRNCLKDFIVDVDPVALLRWFNDRDSIGELASQAESSGGGKGQPQVERFLMNEKILAMASALISKKGYISTAIARQREIMSTAAWIRWFITDTRDEPEAADEIEVDKILSGVTAQDQQRAKTVLDWFKNLPVAERESNEYMHNLNVIVATEQVNPRNIGYLISLYPLYDKANNITHQKPQKSNEWIGTVGQKIPPTQISVIRTRSIDGHYGTVQVVTMEDAAGNVYTWFNNSQMRMEEGDQHTIVGTVKEHGDFNGRKQTVLTRVKTT